MARGGKEAAVVAAFRLAQERFGACGVNVDLALRRLSRISVSLHCWQGDDVGGFERSGLELDGGLAVTGNYPGKARTPEELRADLDKAMSLIPGRHRLNLHASYGEFGARRVDRDEIAPRHFRHWIDWAKSKRIGMDFNPTYFAHPKAADGFTLSHPRRSIRAFWIEHGIRCREIGAAIGRALGTPCVTNVWIPDGYKDTPVDRDLPRRRLLESLDAIMRKPMAPRYHLDSVEPKLFGIGSESYVVGSHEFYLGYAASRQKLLCLDAGHFHPTESIADKISAALLYVPAVLLHVSRGVRWDSDHVVTLTDDLLAITRAVVAGGHLGKVHFGLDYFDASLNRVAAWVIGVRNLIKALLQALLEPLGRLRQAEKAGDFTTRLALQEEAKSMPVGAVWDYYCLRSGVPIGAQWLSDIKQYEKDVLSKR